MRSTLLRKIFSLGELRYGWLLAISVAVCVVAFYVDEQWNPREQLWLSLFYFASFLLAVLWGGANYVGHIRVNAMYRRQHDIAAYVNQLALSAEDKTELRNYLEDYAADLERQGRTKEEAEREAVSQFKVKEFLSMSKHTRPFESHGHHYLIGYAAIALAAAAAAALIDGLTDSYSLPGLIATTLLTVYGICFVALFVLYKIVDKFLYKKLQDYFS